MLEFGFVILETQLSSVNSNSQKSFQTSCVRFCVEFLHFLCLQCFWTAEISCQSNWDYQHFLCNNFFKCHFFLCVFIHGDYHCSSQSFNFYWHFFRWKFKLLFVLNLSLMFVLMYLCVVVSPPLRKHQTFLYHRYFVLTTLYIFIKKYTIKL